MQYSSAILALGAFAATVIAQASLQFTSFPPNSVSAGSSYPITYMTANGQISSPVQILLRSGPSNNLVTVADLTKGITVNSGSFNFKVPTNIANGDNYALEIIQGQSNNYSPQFSVTGASGSSSSSAASSSAASSTAASSGYGASSSMAATSSGSSAMSTYVPYPAGNGTAAGPTGASGVLPPLGTGTGVPVPSSNSSSTFSSAMMTPTASSGSGSSTGGSAPAASTTSASSSGAGMLTGSPIALLICAVASFALLN